MGDLGHNAKEGAVFSLPSSGATNSQVCVPENTWELKVHSFGHFAGESSFDHPFPVLLLQVFIRMLVSRCLYYLLRPLKQPRIVGDIIGCMLTSPAVLGRIRLQSEAAEENLYTLIFPNHKQGAVTRTIANTGLMFYFFLIAVQMQPSMIVRSGKKVWAIGICSLFVPFTVVGSLLLLLGENVWSGIGRSRFIISVAGTVTVTSFAVVADILAELQLLNSELGRLALAASMVQGVFVVALDVIFIVVVQGQQKWEYSLFALLSLASFVAVIVFAFRPWALQIVRRTPRSGRVEERYILAIMFMMVGMGAASEFIGAKFILLPIIMGLALPEGPPLGSAVVERMQLMINEVIMPLIFFLPGGHIEESQQFSPHVWVLLAVVCIGYVAKVVGTMIPAIYYRVPLKSAFLLGLVMNFRGLVEMINFHMFRMGGLLDEESYTMMLITIIIATGVASPIVTLLCKPTGNRFTGRRRSIQHLKQHLKANTELCILACVRNDGPVPAIINLIEASCPTEETPLCVYVLHLVDLAGRVNSSLTAHKDKRGFINPSGMDPLHNAFTQYQQQKKGRGLEVQPFTSVSPTKTMYQDICLLATEKNVALIVVPFRRSRTSVLNDDIAIRSNIPEILIQAPCSVGILIYADDLTPATTLVGKSQYQIGILFWGGPDDREALSYASRMACHSGISLAVINLMQSVDRRDVKQRQLDDNLLARVHFENMNNESVTIDEVVVRDAEQTLTVIKSLRNSYNLLLVGRRQGANSLLEEGLGDWSECRELGVVGDLLASKDFASSSSVLVVHQQN